MATFDRVFSCLLAAADQSAHGLWFLLAFPLALIALLTGLGMWEKRLAWPYSGLNPGPSKPAAETNYAQLRINEARALGFRLLGWAVDVRGAMYNVNFAFMVSPDNNALVVIAAGKIMNASLKGTAIHSPSAEGARSFYSTDNQAGIEFDLLRDWKSQLVPKSSFARLWSRHLDLLADRKMQPIRFEPTRELDIYRAVRVRHFDEMARRGHIRFMEGSPRFFRYTFTAAVRLSVCNYSLGLLRGLTVGRFPRVV